MNEPTTFNSIAESGPFERYIAKRFKRSEEPIRPFVALFFIVLFTYVPLLVLSAIDGRLTKTSGLDIPFLVDFGVQFRYLLAVPLLIVTKSMITRWTVEVSEYISDYLLDEQDRNEVFLPAYEKVRKLNNSWISEAIIAVVVVVVSMLVLFNRYDVEHSSSLRLSGWAGNINGEEITLTTAGWWSMLVSNCIWRFILIRWLWLYGGWFWLLVKVASCKLKMAIHHRDRACGLNLLVQPQKSFNMAFIALAISSSGTMINQIMYEHASFEMVKMEIIVLVVASFVMLLGPFLFFMPKLLAAKANAHLMMSKKASQLSAAYHKMWIEGDVIGNGDDEMPDPSVMADFNTTYEVAEKIKPFPFEVSDLLVMAAPIALAFVPTLLTNMSLKEIIEVAMRFIV